MGDYYITLADSGIAEFTEKHSRFIGYAKPVTTEAEAVAFINEKKKQHYDARHNVYAYSLRNGQIKRYSDDGEPQGTAGVPVLEVINKNSVVDAVVVVTRYFGGILLGAGGLVRAYSHSASIALEAAGIVRMEKCFSCRIKAGYDRYGKLSGLIAECGGDRKSTRLNSTIQSFWKMSCFAFISPLICSAYLTKSLPMQQMVSYSRKSWKKTILQFRNCLENEW